MLKTLWDKAKKLVLVKKIVSQEGVLHFRRWRLVWTPWFSIYLHNITKSDEDIDEHEHPWDFVSLILKGSYQEDATYYTAKNPIQFAATSGNPIKSTTVFEPGDVNRHITTDTHKLTLLTPSVWTLVFVGKRKHDWGYQTAKGWIHHKEYNRLRKERKAKEEFRWN